jgi:hypothetical protein
MLVHSQHVPIRQNGIRFRSARTPPKSRWADNIIELSQAISPLAW